MPDVSGMELPAIYENLVAGSILLLAVYIAKKTLTAIRSFIVDGKRINDERFSLRLEDEFATYLQLENIKSWLHALVFLNFIIGIVFILGVVSPVAEGGANYRIFTKVWFFNILFFVFVIITMLNLYFMLKYRGLLRRLYLELQTTSESSNAH